VKLFLPQTTLEEWALAEKADLRGERLVVPAEKAEYPVVPAVHFVSVVSGEDEKKLLTKVKTQPQLEKLGAEQLHDSVVMGDTAYEVVPGYVAEVTVTQDGAKPVQDADLLASFLLNKL
jgi:hypothetical protein